METEVFCLGHEYTVEWKYIIIFTSAVQSAWKCCCGDTITKNDRVIYFLQKYNFFNSDRKNTQEWVGIILV